jgi:choline dehydrogenase
VLANRLTEDPNTRVVLLEAGGRDWNPLIHVPAGYMKLLDHPTLTWGFKADKDSGLNGREISYPRGKVLGGSSSINGMIYIRSQPEDYDHWAQLGNRGWSYSDVLPVFKKMESYDGGSDEFRGRDGILKVTDTKERGPLYDALIAGAAEAGITFNPDYNGASQEGVAMTQATICNGRRMSTAYCYLDPARGRPNLEIQTEALTRSLILDGRRCVGVRYSAGGQEREARAGREVIVSAGSINSPQLLELSGIGRPEVLQKHGIDVRHALNGVGENLRDHYSPRMKWAARVKGVTYNDRARGIGLVGQVFKYALTRSGFMAMPATPIRFYFRSREGLESPDCTFACLPFIVGPGRTVAPQRGITVNVNVLRSESTGSIHVKSPDPTQAPAISFNFLSAAHDRTGTLFGMRKAREVMTTKAMRTILGGEIAPGEPLETDDELLDWVRRTAETTYHPVGTCKMGQDPMAVVDERLRVRGIGGLRVADASIMPTLTSGNTNAPAIMIGEKASSMVLEDAG